jgi:hypothetical protein
MFRSRWDNIFSVAGEMTTAQLLEEAYGSMSFIVDGDEEFSVKLPVLDGNGTSNCFLIVDWGDGSDVSAVIVAGEGSYGSLDHTYSAGSYTLKISGFSDYIGNWPEEGRDNIVGLSGAKGDMGLVTLSFANLEYLVSVVQLPHYENLVSADSMFSTCSSLESIPYDFFHNNLQLHSFDSTFEFSGLVHVPAGLFVGLTNPPKFFTRTFEGSAVESIDGQIFSGPPSGNPLGLHYIFVDCEGLTDISEDALSGCPSVSTTTGMFENCSNLESIPEKLITNIGPSLVSMHNDFSGCSSLSSLPENLFKNSNIHDLINVFSGSGLEEIPENLFKYTALLSNVTGLFKDCASILSVPDNLFKYNSGLIFSSISFSSCYSISQLPVNLFLFNNNLSAVNRLFEGCGAMEGTGQDFIDVVLGNTSVVVGEFTADCFTDCESLTDYDDLVSDGDWAS